MLRSWSIAAVCTVLIGSIGSLAWIEYIRNGHPRAQQHVDSLTVRRQFLRELIGTYDNIATSFEQIDSKRSIKDSMKSIADNCNRVCSLIDESEDLPPLTAEQQKDFQISYRDEHGPELDRSLERLFRSVEHAFDRVPERKSWQPIATEFKRAADRISSGLDQIVSGSVTEDTPHYINFR